MRKQLLIALSILLLGGGGTLAWYFWPQQEAPAPPPPSYQTIPFLASDTLWVDSVFNTLSLEQKIGQLLHVRTSVGAAEEDSLVLWLNKGYLGGVHLQQAHLTDQVLLTNTLRNTTSLPLFVSSDEPIHKGVKHHRIHEAAIHNDSTLHLIDSTRIVAWKSLGINLVVGPTLRLSPHDTAIHYNPFAVDTLRKLQRDLTFFKALEAANLLGVVNAFDTYQDYRQDTLNLRDSILHRYTYFTHEGTGALMVHDSVSAPYPKAELDQGHLKKHCLDYLHFEGLILSNAIFPDTAADPYFERLYAGVDVLFVEDSIPQIIQHIEQLYSDGRLSEQHLTHKVKKVLKAKYWTAQHQVDSLEETAASHSHESAWREVITRSALEQSMVLVNNAEEYLPIRTIRNDSMLMVLTIGNSRTDRFNSRVADYSIRRLRRLKVKDGVAIKPLSKSWAKYNPVLLNLNDVQVDPARDSAFIQSLETLAEKTELVITNFGNPQNIVALENLPVLLQSWKNSPLEQDLACQVLFGGIPAKGQLPLPLGQYPYRHGILQDSAVRFKYTIPEELGIDNDSLYKIDQIVNTVMDRKATPGCQVLFAKEGKVFYHKSFGFHTYRKNEVVAKDDLYDLASITKIAATTLLAMQQYEQGRYQLHEQLEKHLPDTLQYTNLSGLTFHEILTHRTGLSSGMNILKFLQYQTDSVGRFDRYFCDAPDDTLYKVLIADSMWMDSSYHDTIWVDLNQQWIDKSKRYKYSDANYNLLYFLIRSWMPPRLQYDHLADSLFYAPLGLQTMGYRPRERFALDRIVPTENEKYWRYQLLHGHVHDPTAALLGGVAGNAGLFSNANDLAILHQMLLNGGTYGRHRFFKQETVELFTKKQDNGHRGLGFNKPLGDSTGIVAYDAPTSTYGHTGFTGTCAWVDPDLELVYVFLSNRVHPKATNKTLVRNGTRKRIHQVIYDQLKPTALPETEAVSDTTFSASISSVSWWQNEQTCANDSHFAIEKHGSFWAALPSFCASFWA